MMADPREVFRALSNSTRLDILREIAKHKRICVCELVQCLGISQSGVSNHLAVLKRAGLVEDSKAGVWVFYAVNVDVLSEACGALREELDGFLEASIDENPEKRLVENVRNGVCCPEAVDKLPQI